MNYLMFFWQVGALYLALQNDIGSLFILHEYLVKNMKREKDKKIPHLFVFH